MYDHLAIEAVTEILDGLYLGTRLRLQRGNVWSIVGDTAPQRGLHGHSSLSLGRSRRIGSDHFKVGNQELVDAGRGK
jgi:hypothetical protein